MPKSPEQNFNYNPSLAELEAEVVLRNRDLDGLKKRIEKLQDDLLYTSDSFQAEKIKDLIRQEEESLKAIGHELENFKLLTIAKKLEQNPGCEKCGALVGDLLAFCGVCGTQNADFDEREFKKDKGSSLEEMKKQQGCATGHGSAMEDAELMADYCIYCGKKY